MMSADTSQNISGTVLTKETPFTPEDPNDYEYPFPSSRNQLLYKKYENKAMENPDLLICGRLGEYKYYDMDQAIARAMNIADKLIESDYDEEKSYNSRLSAQLLQHH